MSAAEAPRFDFVHADDPIVKDSIPVINQDKCHVDAMTNCHYTKRARHIAYPVLKEQLNSKKPVRFVDLRRPAEQAVSTAPNAYRVPYEGTLVDAEATMQAWEIPPEIQDDETNLVVCYCTAGYRGSVAATVLEERMQRPVYNLGGGLTAWYNAGEPVVDAHGNRVEQMHPCTPKIAPFCHRQNNFSLE